MILEIIDELIKINSQDSIEIFKEKVIFPSFEIDEIDALLYDYNNLKKQLIHCLITQEEYVKEVKFLEQEFIEKFGYRFSWRAWIMYICIKEKDGKRTYKVVDTNDLSIALYLYPNYDYYIKSYKFTNMLVEKNYI